MREEVSKFHGFFYYKKKNLIVYLLIDEVGHLEYDCVPCWDYWLYMPMSGKVIENHFMGPFELKDKLWTTWLWKIRKEEIYFLILIFHIFSIFFLVFFRANIIIVSQ